MDSTTDDLLNELRTASVGQSSGPRIRQLADRIEAVLRTVGEQKAVIHTTMAQMGSELAAVTAELNEVRQKLSEAEEKVRYLIAQRFGRSRERWTDTEELQAQLFPELEMLLAKESIEPGEAVEEPSTPVPQASARRGKRKPLPAGLKRIERIVDLPEDEKRCPSCGKELEKIGEDVSERLQVIPEQFYVEATIRPRFACVCGCCGVKQAAVPVQVAPKSSVGETVAAQVVTAKFCDGVPFHRQSRILASRFGVEISEQTIGRTAKAVATILEPVATMIQEGLVRCPVVCGDETRLRVLHEDGTKKEGLSWMWVLAGETAGRRYVRFRYDPGRGTLRGERSWQDTGERSWRTGTGCTRRLPGNWDSPVRRVWRTYGVAIWTCSRRTRRTRMRRPRWR